jgi:hypothetical protein
VSLAAAALYLMPVGLLRIVSEAHGPKRLAEMCGVAKQLSFGNGGNRGCPRDRVV